MPFPRGGRLPRGLPPPVPPEAIDGLAEAFPDIPVGDLNRALNALFLELFVRGRLPASEEGGDEDGQEDAEKQRLPARPGDATAANPRAPEPPQPPDPTSALPTPTTSEREHPRKSRAAERFTVGTAHDVLTERTIVQPTADREQLLRQAEDERLRFEAKLQDIAAGATGTDVFAPRIKGRPRLQEKINEFHEEMREQGVEPESPDAGANLIRDYLAGKLVPKTQGALDAVMQEVRRRFEINDIKDYMQMPDPQTGYTAIHFQVKLPNGMTAELQVQPEPFERASEAQRQLFEKWRAFAGNIPPDLSKEYQADTRESRRLFAQAWTEWINSGGKDPRLTDVTP